LHVPLYGILHEEKGAEEFNKFLQGDLLLDEKVCLLADYSAATNEVVVMRGSFTKAFH